MPKKKEKNVDYTTQLVDIVYFQMKNYLTMVKGQLFKERLHDVILTLAREMINFIGRLVERSQDEAQKRDIAGYVRM